MRLDRGAGRPGDRQTSGETKQRLKWRHHYTHIREQGHVQDETMKLLVNLATWGFVTEELKCGRRGGYTVKNPS
jgi:hypothetical protein